MDCKLYIITHSDLPLKYQVPQSNHAAMEFAAQYPAEFLEWHKKSNSIIVLNCQNERKLVEFAQKLRDKGIKFSEFREPDIGDELTAISFLVVKQGRDIVGFVTGMSHQWDSCP